MHYTIELLINKDRPVADYYAAAVDRWNEIAAHIDLSDVDKLARRLTDEQMWFEENCGGRFVGQEIMVVIGIARYYTTAEGFDDKLALARHVNTAFQKSACSLEVRHHANAVAKAYRLLED